MLEDHYRKLERKYELLEEENVILILFRLMETQILEVDMRQLFEP